jgi:hypothetical protein
VSSAKPPDGHLYELDIAEERMTFPTQAGCHQHKWQNGGGTDLAPWDGGITVSNMATNWHVYSADVTATKVSYYVDGALCGNAYGAPGSHGILLDNVLGAPGSWGGGGALPASGDPGPWDFLVDYVRVTAL